MIWILIVCIILLSIAGYLLGRRTGYNNTINPSTPPTPPAWTPEKQEEITHEIENRPDTQLADDLNDMLSQRRGDTDSE